MARVKQILEQAGVKTVYEEYPAEDTIDYSPFLTKIKYANPHVLVTYLSYSEAYLTMVKQIMQMGGWGDTKTIGTSGCCSGGSLCPLCKQI